MFCFAVAAAGGLPRRARFIQEKSMETRCFAPGSLVSNLDFVETIFGNAGDPVPAGERRGSGRGALARPHRAA